MIESNHEEWKIEAEKIMIESTPPATTDQKVL